MSPRNSYLIAALLLVVAIPTYFRIHELLEETQAVPTQVQPLTPASVASRAYGMTDVNGLATKGFIRGKPLPSGYECSSAWGYVVAVKHIQGQKRVEPVMANGQMLRCLDSVYGGNVR